MLRTLTVQSCPSAPRCGAACTSATAFASVLLPRTLARTNATIRYRNSASGLRGSMGGGKLESGTYGLLATSLESSRRAPHRRQLVTSRGTFLMAGGGAAALPLGAHALLDPSGSPGPTGQRRCRPRSPDRRCSVHRPAARQRPPPLAPASGTPTLRPIGAFPGEARDERC